MIRSHEIGEEARKGMCEIKAGREGIALDLSFRSEPLAIRSGGQSVNGLTQI